MFLGNMLESYRTAPHHNPEGSGHNYRCENLRSATQLKCYSLDEGPTYEYSKASTYAGQHNIGKSVHVQPCSPVGL
jgi:hypothetical protein